MPYYRIYIDLFQIQRKARVDQKEPEPNAVQIFKDCHTSKMKGMSTPVQAAVVSPYSSCLELIGTMMCHLTTCFAANVSYSVHFYTQLS